MNEQPEQTEQLEQLEQPHYMVAQPARPVEQYRTESLTLDQKKMLAALLEEPTPRKAALASGVPLGRYHRWLREDENFRAAIGELGSGLLYEARARLDSLLPQAAATFEEAMESEAGQRIWVECPDCGNRFQAQALVPDLKTRLGVAKDLFKRSGDLAAKVQVTGEVKHRDMALEDRLALAQVTAWMARGQLGPCPVPPDVFRSLQTRGLLDSPGGESHGPQVLSPAQAVRIAGTQDPDSDILEGEYQTLAPTTPA